MRCNRPGRSITRRSFPREIILRAFELNATALILIHNHPSGDPSPSKTDIQMTRQIVSLGKSPNVAAHDHLIIGRDAFTSLKSLQLI
jgi:DNA repair protein RadC